jgi:hypothetical protein
MNPNANDFWAGIYPFLQFLALVVEPILVYVVVSLRVSQRSLRRRLNDLELEVLALRHALEDVRR